MSVIITLQQQPLVFEMRQWLKEHVGTEDIHWTLLWEADGNSVMVLINDRQQETLFALRWAS